MFRGSPEAKGKLFTVVGPEKTPQVNKFQGKYEVSLRIVAGPPTLKTEAEAAATKGWVRREGES